MYDLKCSAFILFIISISLVSDPCVMSRSPDLQLNLPPSNRIVVSSFSQFGRFVITHPVLVSGLSSSILRLPINPSMDSTILVEISLL